MDGQELKGILAQAMGTKLQNPIYLASGFFTDTQKENLKEFEELLSKQGKNYYSPRKHTVDFTKSKNKPAVIDAIFKSNVDNIDESDEVHCFLDTSMGGYDMGTVWELGYAIGSYAKDKSKDHGNIHLHLSNDGTEFVFEAIKDNLIELAGIILSSNSSTLNEATKSLLICKDNVVKAQDTIDTLGYNMNFHNLNSLLANAGDLFKRISESKHLLFVIDNRPYQSTALMGLLYAFGIPYKTASIQGHGSNVMIAASSEGHIQLPGFYDEKKSNKQID